MSRPVVETSLEQDLPVNGLEVLWTAWLGAGPREDGCILRDIYLGIECDGVYAGQRERRGQPRVVIRADRATDRPVAQ